MLTPGSPEWLRTITPSKVPAILGISRYQSQYALWHEMAGNVVRDEPDAGLQEVFDEGHALEAAARVLWLRQHPGWRASRGEVQYVRDDLTFPAAATLDLRACRGRLRRIVEVKSARSLEEWGDDGSGIVPADYWTQVQAQMGISGIHTADLVLWPTYGRPRTYPIKWDPEAWVRIISRCAHWHRSLAADEPPELDDTLATYETVRKLHPDIRDEEVVIDGDLADEARYVTATIKRLKRQETGVKSRLLDAMAGARVARDPDGAVVATLQARGTGRPFPTIKEKK